MPRTYIPSKALLTTREMIEVLNLDSDYPFTQRLDDLSYEATQRIYQLTGHDWSADETVSPVARGAVRDYVVQAWYEGDDHIQRRFDSSIILLKSMVDADGNLYEED